MLILSRRTGESIVIDGRIIVKVMRLEGEVVKIGIEAPANVPVHRQEVYDEIRAGIGPLSGVIKKASAPRPPPPREGPSA